MSQSKISIVLQAVDKATAPIQRVSKKYEKLSGELKALKAIQATDQSTLKKIEQWQKLGEKLGGVSEEYKIAKKYSDELNTQIKSAIKPTKALAKEMYNAERKVAKLGIAEKKVTNDLQKLEAELNETGLSTKDFSRRQQELTTKVKSTGLQINKYGDQLTKLNSKMSKSRKLSGLLRKNFAQTVAYAGLAGQALSNVGRGMMGALLSPVKAAAQFESAMADVKKVVDFGSPEGAKAFENSLMKMSTHIPITASGLAEIAAAGGQLGIKNNALAPFVDTAAKMSTAFDMLPSEAGESMATLSNIFQIPIPEIGVLGDAVNHLSDNTAARANGIINVLRRAGGTAKQFGLHATQTAALGSTFIALGKAPEVAGTAINALLLKLQTSTKQGAKFQSALEEIGLSAGDMEDSIAENGQAALMNFLETLEGVDGQDRAGILSDLFGMEYADDISLLAGNLDQYRKAVELTRDATKYAGSMQREFENRSATTGNAWQLLQNKMSNFQASLGKNLLPVMRDLMSMVGRAIEKFGVFAKAHPNLIKYGLLAAGAIGVLGVVLAPIIILLTALAPLLSLAALKMLIVVGVIGGLVYGAYALIKNWQPVANWFSNMWTEIKGAFWSGVASILEAVHFVTSAMPDWALPEGLEAKNIAATVAEYKKLADVSDKIKPVEFALPGVSDIVADLGIDDITPVGPQLATTGAPLSQVTNNSAQNNTSSNKSVVNHFQINASQGQDPQAIADQVASAIEARERGALHD